MQSALFAAVTAITLGLFPYGLAAAMPSWRWLLACTIFVGGGLAALWIQYFAGMPQDYDEAHDVFAIAIALCITIAFGAGILARIVSLVMGAYGWSFKSIVTMNVVGFLLFVITCSAPFVLHVR